MHSHRGDTPVLVAADGANPEGALFVWSSPKPQEPETAGDGPVTCDVCGGTAQNQFIFELNHSTMWDGGLCTRQYMAKQHFLGVLRSGKGDLGQQAAAVRAVRLDPRVLAAEVGLEYDD